MLRGKVVKVRWVKPYVTAHNHIAIGRVLHETSQYLALLCKTYHFGDNIGGRGGALRQGEYTGGVLESEKAVRMIPWGRIEVIHELPAKTDWDVKATVDQRGVCCLDNANHTLITRPPTRGP